MSEEEALKAVIQRTKKASVSVEGKLIAAIEEGLLVLLGIAQPDTEKDLDYVVRKISNLRIFSNAEGKMDLSIRDRKGSILLVSQFTLLANTKKGNRPSFVEAASPEKGLELYEKAIAAFQREGIEVKTGYFGANMQVELQNDGPVTIVLES